MSTIPISLPDELRDFVETQMARDGYSSASEYFQALLRNEQRQSAKRELEAKLLRGLEGPAVEMNTEDWDSIEREAHQRF